MSPDHVEVERRYRLSDEEWRRLLQRYDWSAMKRVCDLTLGPSGATSMQTDGWIVRLRDTGGEVRLEYKAPRDSDWSSWIEYGTSVGSFREALKIMTAIGLKPGLFLDRTRRMARVEGAALSLDDVVGLGRFIEIEVEAVGPDDSGILSKSGARLGALAGIERLRRSLGLAERTHERPYGELLLDRIRSDAQFGQEHDALVRKIADGR